MPLWWFIGTYAWPETPDWFDEEGDGEEVELPRAVAFAVVLLAGCITGWVISDRHELDPLTTIRDYCDTRLIDQWGTCNEASAGPP